MTIQDSSDSASGPHDATGESEDAAHNSNISIAGDAHNAAAPAHEAPDLDLQMSIEQAEEVRRTSWKTFTSKALRRLTCAGKRAWTFEKGHNDFMIILHIKWHTLGAMRDSADLQRENRLFISLDVVQNLFTAEARKVLGPTVGASAIFDSILRDTYAATLKKADDALEKELKKCTNTIEREETLVLSGVNHSSLMTNAFRNLSKECPADLRSYAVQLMRSNIAPLEYNKFAAAGHATGSKRPAEDSDEAPSTSRLRLEESTGQDSASVAAPDRMTRLEDLVNTLQQRIDGYDQALADHKSTLASHGTQIELNTSATIDLRDQIETLEAKIQEELSKIPATQPGYIRLADSSGSESDLHTALHELSEQLVGVQATLDGYGRLNIEKRLNAIVFQLTSPNGWIAKLKAHTKTPGNLPTLQTRTADYKEEKDKDDGRGKK